MPKILKESPRISKNPERKKEEMNGDRKPEVKLWPDRKRLPNFRLINPFRIVGDLSLEDPIADLFISSSSLCNWIGWTILPIPAGFISNFGIFAGFSCRFSGFFKDFLINFQDLMSNFRILSQISGFLKDFLIKFQDFMSNFRIFEGF